VSQLDFHQIAPELRQDYELNMICLMLKHPECIASVADVLSANNFKHKLPSISGGSVALSVVYNCIIKLWAAEPVNVLSLTIAMNNAAIANAGAMLAYDLAAICKHDLFLVSNASFHAFVLLQEDFYTAAKKAIENCRSALMKMLTNAAISPTEALAREKYLDFISDIFNDSNAIFESIDKAVSFYEKAELEMELAEFTELNRLINSRVRLIANRNKVQHMLNRASEVAMLDSRSKTGMRILVSAMLKLLNPTKDHQPLLTQLEALKL